MIDNLVWSRAMQTIRQIGRDYRRIRAALDGKRLSGMVIPHDHPVGVVGEFWARYFYEVVRHARTALPSSPISGHDIVATGRRISVKAISEWSAVRHQGPLRGKEWDELCLVHLSKSLVPVKLGVARRSHLERTGRLGKRVALSWLEPGGYITDVYEWLDAEFVRRGRRGVPPSRAAIRRLAVKRAI